MTQLEMLAGLWRDGVIRYILVAGGWSDGMSYNVASKPVFAPKYLRDCLVELGVPAHCIFAAPQSFIKHWTLNVVSTWGEVKQMLRLLRGLMDMTGTGQAELVFVGMPTHMQRAIWLWRCYNWLMTALGRGVHMKIDNPVPLGIEPDPEWLKGEWSRNLIAYIDCFGVWIAWAIHMLRRWQARKACPR